MSGWAALGVQRGPSPRTLAGPASAEPSGPAHLPPWSRGLVSGPPVCWASVSCSWSPLLMDILGLERVRPHSYLNLYSSWVPAQYNPIVLTRSPFRSISWVTPDFFLSSSTAPGLWRFLVVGSSGSRECYDREVVLEASLNSRVR